MVSPFARLILGFKKAISLEFATFVIRVKIEDDGGGYIKYNKRYCFNYNNVLLHGVMGVCIFISFYYQLHFELTQLDVLFEFSDH